jgi:hypothetical protein
VEGLYRLGVSFSQVIRPAFGMRILYAGDVEEGGGDGVAEEDAEDNDCGLHEFVDDLASVGHGRRVNGNALMVLAADQIILKICSNVSGEKIGTKCRNGMRFSCSLAVLTVPQRNTYVTGVMSAGGGVVSGWV